MNGSSIRAWAIRGMLVSMVLMVTLKEADARDVFLPRLGEMEQSFNRERKSVPADWIPEDDCPVHKAEHVHTVMDRVCLMCHEMFSHQVSTLRFECRKNCFDNTVFRRCLNIFTAPGQGQGAAMA